MSVAIYTLLLVLAPSLVVAQLRELEAVQLEAELTRLAQSSLEQERAALLLRGADLSDTIDSLKIAAPVSHEFTEARLLAMGLNQELTRLHQRLDSLATCRDSLRSRQLTIYAWEISRLMGLLSEEWDDGLAEQLSIYLQEREGLGYDVAASQMRYGEALALSQSDGPTQISRKIGLLQDRLGILRDDLSTVDRRLQRLTSQTQSIQRMRLRRRESLGLPLEVTGVMTDAPMARLSGAVEMTDTRTEQAPEGVSASSPSSTISIRGHGPDRGACVDPGEALLLQMLQRFQLKIFQLTARQQAARESEGVLLERIQAFKLRRQNLLDGRE